MMKRPAGIVTLTAFAFAATMAMAQETRAPAPPLPSALAPLGARFDFYVLALSWSPTYCAGPRGETSRQQCGLSRKFGFIVHGLWPQYERGYPEFCDSAQPRDVPEEIGRALTDITPDRGLIGHQWRKHGTCSGLSQRDYFSATRAAAQRVRVPDTIGQKAQVLSANALEDAFIAANPGLDGGGVAIACQGRLLQEVRICLNKDLGFRDCPQIDRQGCRQAGIEIPPIK